MKLFRSRRERGSSWFSGVLRASVAVALMGHEAWASAPGVLAQTTAPGPNNQAPNIVSGRSFGFEIALVAVLFAGALFVVCRSSNRHT